MEGSPLRLIYRSRKTGPLKPPEFGCLRGTPSVNITVGCAHQCVYCYARGFRDAPPRGEVHLYTNLPEVLEMELERRRRLPKWVSFSTASDPFQPLDEVLETTYRTMLLLLERGIGVSFLTKGIIPEEFIRLFQRHRRLIKARIGLVSPEPLYRRLFEPHTATFEERLKNIQNLCEAGIETSVRIDPVVPNFFRDDQMELLLKMVKDAGVVAVSVSCLVMRPTIMRQFTEELPEGVWRPLLGLYRGRPWQRVITSARTALLPPELRLRIYRTVKKLAESEGLECRICGCKNPDLKREYCNPWVDNSWHQRQGQLF